jgi:predicted nuclease of predicted toxin-antitoxin system
MKLLFDQNLSFKLCDLLADLFPNSAQARLIAMDESDDHELWEYARDNGYVFVTQDVDFFNLSTLHGFPPKIIWLRCGNQRTALVEALLRDNFAAIEDFEADAAVACLELT